MKKKENRFENICKTLDLTQQEVELFVLKYSTGKYSDVQDLKLNMPLSYKKLEAFLHSKTDVYADMWRKRCIAVISEYLEITGHVCICDKLIYIKAVACRAAEAKVFNKMTVFQLRSVYSAFVKQNRALKNAKNYTKIINPKFQN